MSPQQTTASRLLVTKGQSRVLPNAAKFEIGLGWDAAGGVGESPDLDLIVFRVRKNGTVEPLCWPNTKWERPDLGANSQGSPYIATPELDAVHTGDDRTGAESEGSYDEIVTLDLSKAPSDVERYIACVSIYDEDEVGLTLGTATNIQCGVKDVIAGHEAYVKLEQDNGFDVSARIADIIHDPHTGRWSMKAVEDGGTSGHIFALGTSLGVKWHLWNDSIQGDV
jgi:tellurium resistance protein TerD